LAAAPTNMSANAAITGPVGVMAPGVAASSLKDQTPVVTPSRISPPMRVSPPSPVTMNACIALRTAPGSSRSQPISRNELIEVSSQNSSIRMKLSESATPTIAVMNRCNEGRKRNRAAASGPK